MRIEWSRETGIVKVNGSYEGKVDKVASNQQRLLMMVNLGSGDWISSPFLTPDRDLDIVRSITQKTVSRLNLRLKTIKIITRNNGTEVKVIDKP